MAKTNEIRIVVTNPETRDQETYTFQSIDDAVAWLTKRKNTKKIPVNDGK